MPVSSTSITASSGAEGLAILAEQEVAVLLVDQRMPGMTGVEVFEIAQERYPDSVRILITAFTDLTEAIAAINRGHIRRYLRKPWEPEELKAALREAVEIYQTRKKIADLETRLLETERTYALGVVAAGVAHELRNPLAAMSMNLELARIRLDAMNRSIADGGFGRSRQSGFAGQCPGKARRSGRERQEDRRGTGAQPPAARRRDRPPTSARSSS